MVLPSRIGKIAVIGGGPIGTSVALHLGLAGVGADVTVYERDTTYQKCSALLSAGGIRQQFSLKENILMSKYSFEFLHDIEERSKDKGFEIAFRRNGYLFLGRNDADKAILEANNQMQRECGVDWTHLADKAKLDEVFPWLNTEDLTIGSYSAGGGEGYFDPWAFIQAMRAEAKELGVTFVNEDISGSKARRRPDGFQIQALHTASGATVDADHVINCAGAWSGKVFEQLTSSSSSSSGSSSSGGGGNHYPPNGAIGLPIVRRKRCIFSIDCPGTQAFSHPVPPTTTPLTIDPTGVYVFCYTIVLPSFLDCNVSVSLSFSYPSIAACLLAFTDTT
jgi:FAD-dependent oxidoreductase domain-containing protein 1